MYISVADRDRWSGRDHMHVCRQASTVSLFSRGSCHLSNPIPQELHKFQLAKLHAYTHTLSLSIPTAYMKEEK